MTDDVVGIIDIKATTDGVDPPASTGKLSDAMCLSYDHEREGRSQNDKRIYASDHDAEINVGH